MSEAWRDLIHGERWRSPGTLWVEDDTEYGWEEVSELATAIEAAIRAHSPVRVVRVQSASKVGCFAGQLAAWRAGCVAVTDDGNLKPNEVNRVRPGLTLSVSAEQSVTVEPDLSADDRLPRWRIPDDVVTVNFTSGSTGRRKAVAVTRDNLLALFDCRDLDVPVCGRLTSGSFATPTYDGWWFDTWRTVAAGGTVVCLPNVNEDVFAWPELVEKYSIDRLLLPAAVIAALLEAVPAAVAGIPWLFSGGEQFPVSTCRQARRAGLMNRFVNLYGPTEATFATHRYELPDSLPATTIPIGKPLDGCLQQLLDVDGRTDCSHELVVGGPFVCMGYLEDGALAHQFDRTDGQRWYRTGDVVQVDGDGNLLFAGRLDSQIKVNGMRVDTAALEHEVMRLPGVSGCRVIQHEQDTLAVVRVDRESPSDVRTAIDSVVKRFSGAIAVRLVNRFPVKPGGKVDTAALIESTLYERRGLSK